MGQTVLITLGRLPKGLDIARSFRAMGWRVLVAEPFGWHLSRTSRAVARSFKIAAPNSDHAAYEADILAIVKQYNVSLIVPISEETMHVAALEKVLPDHVKLFTVSQDQILQLHDKLTFARLATSFGLKVPDTATAASPRADSIAARGPWIMKDRLGASGSQVSFHEAGEPIERRAQGVLVQQRLQGRELSTFSIVHKGHVSVTVAYEPVIRDGTVSVVFSRIGPDDPALSAITGWVDQFSAGCGHTGFLSFDMMLSPHRSLAAFECNPRANSGIHFLETEDIARAILEPGFRPRFKQATRMQQAYPTLTLLWASIGDWPRYRQILGALFSARDVTWSWRDPLPFLLMTPATWPILRQAIFEGRSLGKAAIHDVGWFEKP